MHEALLPTYFAEGEPARLVFEVVGFIALLGSIALEVYAHSHQDAIGPKRARAYFHSLTLTVLFVALIVSMIEFYDRFRDPTAATIMSPHAFWWGLAFAVSLYWVRGVLPFLYGLFEIIVGVFALAVAASTPALTVLGQFIALAAGVYIIIRGLDNIDRSLVPPLQRKWRAFWHWPKKQPEESDPSAGASPATLTEADLG